MMFLEASVVLELGVRAAEVLDDPAPPSDRHTSVSNSSFAVNLLFTRAWGARTWFAFIAQSEDARVGSRDVDCSQDSEPHRQQSDSAFAGRDHVTRLSATITSVDPVFAEQRVLSRPAA